MSNQFEKLESLLRSSGCAQPMSVASAIQDLIADEIVTALYEYRLLGSDERFVKQASVDLSDIQGEIEKLGSKPP